MDLQPPSFDSRRKARTLYWIGWRITDIAEELGLNRATVESWKQRGKWEDAPSIQKMESSTEARYVALINKEPKTGQDFKEIDLLGRQAERFARVRRYEEPGGHEGDLNPNVAARNEGPKKKAGRNGFTDEQIEQLRANFEKMRFGYQDVWYQALDQRTRVILKSRQIGATYYFAYEALMDAIDTGHNQIFLSASKSQAHVFKQYIVQFAKAVGVKLTGDPIILANGAEMIFLGTNSLTAQSYHGNFYFDEIFWVYGFKKLKKVAAAMASHKIYRRTYFSTPSSVTHEANDFWSGAEYNKGRPKAEQHEIDVTWRALRHGRKCEDGVWRQIVTLTDAEAGGCDLFDVDEIKRENSVEDYSNLYDCQFTDDTLSQFPLSLMQGCQVDSWMAWSADYQPFAARPYAGEVWLGYDPNESEKGDDAALVAIAPPRVAGGKFRLLERVRMKGFEFDDQSRAIKAMAAKYNVTHIGIDKKGVGAAVYQLVKQWFPTVVGIEYSVVVKTRMVLHTKNIITRRRFEYDAGWHDVTQSFMAIRKVLTGSGEAMTYKAVRGGGVGHADVAWAIMHALDREPLEGSDNPNSQSIMEMS